MKSKKLLIIVIMGLMILTGCSGSARMVKKSPLNVLKMVENEDSFVLVTIREDCQTCSEYRQILQEVSKEENVTIYYIVCLEEFIEDDDMNNLINNYLYYLETIPTTYLIKNGKAQDRWEGLIEKEMLINWLKDYGYIK